MKVKPESRSDGVVVDPLNLLQQHLVSLQQQQQLMAAPHPPPQQQQQQQHSNTSSSSSSATTGNITPSTDVSWQQQQLRAIQHQLLMMHGLPTLMPTTISQPGLLVLSMLCLFHLLTISCWCERKKGTRKPTGPKWVESDASVRPANLTPSCELNLWLPDSDVDSSPFPVDHLCQFVAKSAHSSVKYRFHTIGDGETDGQTDQ